MATTFPQHPIDLSGPNPDRYRPFKPAKTWLSEHNHEFDGEQHQLLSAAEQWLTPLAVESWTSLMRSADHAARLLSGRVGRPLEAAQLLGYLVSRIDAAVSRLEAARSARRFVRPYVKRVHRTARSAYTVLVVL